MSEKKVVLLTGSTGGLGSQIAIGLSNKDYQIALHFHNDKTLAENLKKSLKNPEIHQIFQADLTDASQIEELIKSVIIKFGRLDIVINNAGKSFSGISWKQDLSDWNAIMAINATAPFLINKYAIPHLREQTSGRIINISSIVANRPLVGTSAYAASKSALEGLTKAQAIELSRYGITSNCIAPGYFNVGMIKSIDAETKNELVKEIPLGRLGKAEELVECIVYLCSENASYITGQVIQLNGGLYL